MREESAHGRAVCHFTQDIQEVAKCVAQEDVVAAQPDLGLGIFWQASKAENHDLGQSPSHSLAQLVLASERPHDPYRGPSEFLLHDHCVSIIEGQVDTR